MRSRLRRRPPPAKTAETVGWAQRPIHGQRRSGCGRLVLKDLLLLAALSGDLIARVLSVFDVILIPAAHRIAAAVEGSHAMLAPFHRAQISTQSHMAQCGHIASRCATQVSGDWSRHFTDFYNVGQSALTPYSTQTKPVERSHHSIQAQTIQNLMGIGRPPDG